MSKEEIPVPLASSDECGIAYRARALAALREPDPHLTLAVARTAQPGSVEALLMAVGVVSLVFVWLIVHHRPSTPAMIVCLPNEAVQCSVLAIGSEGIARKGSTFVLPSGVELLLDRQSLPADSGVAIPLECGGSATEAFPAGRIQPGPGIDSLHCTRGPLETPSLMEQLTS